MPIAKFFAALVGALVVTAMLVRPACGCSTKVPSYYATMKADLRNLVTAQESFFTDSLRFARSFDELDSTLYQASTGVSIEFIVARDSGWMAVSRHQQLPEVSCRLWTGTGIEAPDDLDGEPVCNPPYKRRNWEFVWQ